MFFIIQKEESNNMSICQVTYCCQMRGCTAYRKIHQWTVAEGEFPDMDTAIDEKKSSFEKCLHCGNYTKKHFVIYDIFIPSCKIEGALPPHINK